MTRKSACLNKMPYPFNAEDIPPESRAAVLSGINEEVATNFSPVKLSHLSKAEQKKVRDARTNGVTLNPVEILKYQKYRKLLASGPLTVLRGSKNP